jgi:hypothetical protein
MSCSRTRLELPCRVWPWCFRKWWATVRCVTSAARATPSSNDCRRRQLYPCTQAHIDANDLHLRDAAVTIQNSVFLILSHQGSHHHDRLLVEELRKNGVAQEKIRVVWGYCVLRWIVFVAMRFTYKPLAGTIQVPSCQQNTARRSA